MDAIRLLTAPVDAASYEAEGTSTAIVPVSRRPYNSQALTTQSSTSRADSSYPQDRYVWTVSVAEDGTFNFYPVPRSGYANSGQGDSTSQTWQQMWTNWSEAASTNGVNDARYAASQYAYYAAAGSATNGQLVNLYA